MQIAFFLTPVLWKPEQFGRNQVYLPLNPFFDLLEIVRAPLLGYLPAPEVWLAAVLYSVALVMVGWGIFMRARGRIAFWI